MSVSADVNVEMSADVNVEMSVGVLIVEVIGVAVETEQIEIAATEENVAETETERGTGETEIGTGTGTGTDMSEIDMNEREASGIASEIEVAVTEAMNVIEDVIVTEESTVVMIVVVTEGTNEEVAEGKEKATGRGPDRETEGGQRIHTWIAGVQEIVAINLPEAMRCDPSLTKNTLDLNSLGLQMAKLFLLVKTNMKTSGTRRAVVVNQSQSGSKESILGCG